MTVQILLRKHLYFLATELQLLIVTDGTRNKFKKKKWIRNVKN